MGKDSCPVTIHNDEDVHKSFDGSKSWDHGRWPEEMLSEDWHKLPSLAEFKESAIFRKGQLGEKLGSGRYGTVFKATWSWTSESQ